MNSGISKEFLVQEDNFLSQLEKNLYDQLNKLKVEEISLLKLIKSRKHDPIIQAQTSQGSASQDGNDFNVIENEFENPGNQSENNKKLENDKQFENDKQSENSKQQEHLEHSEIMNINETENTIEQNNSFEMETQVTNNGSKVLEGNIT